MVWKPPVVGIGTLLLVFIASLHSFCIVTGDPLPSGRRILVASLFPYIPDAKAAYFDIERAFEDEYPEIDLQINLASYYYGPENDPGSILQQNADVYELDGIFLQDSINLGKIQPLGNGWDDLQNELVQNARSFVNRHGQLFGIPHWLCGSFLIHHSDDIALSNANTFSQIEQAFHNPPPNTSFPTFGLIGDFSSAGTIGGIYFDALVTRYFSLQDAISHIDNPDDSYALKQLHRALCLLRPGYGLDPIYQPRTGLYARRFARGEGRALFGYSEFLHFFIDEGMNSCMMKDKCLDQSQLGIQAWTVSDSLNASSSPTSYVDMLVVDSSVHGTKLRDAETFIRFFTSRSTYHRFLIPGADEAPRYLMPAFVDLFHDPQILAAAPLYPQFLPIISRSQIATSPDLNDRIRRTGSSLMHSNLDCN